MLSILSYSTKSTMITALIPYPEIDPIALQLGPLAIRWYSLAYLFGLLGGMMMLRKRAASPIVPYTPDDALDYLTWCTLGVLLGGRLGLVLFYYPSMIWERPGKILAMWEGGMSFHGGFIGVVVATLLFTRVRKIPFMAFGDEIAVAAPLGLLFGRIANFINGELWGRTTDVSWAMVFPGAGDLPRHPSQLYEALLEGVMLLIVLNALRPWALRKFAPGFLMGVFLIGYAFSRFTVEFVREPDAHLGEVLFGATMGQLLTIPMLIVGVTLVVRAVKAGPTGRPWLTMPPADALKASK